MSQAQAVQVIKWAVGPADRPPPDVETLDEAALTDLAAYHRIEARLLARLEAARPAWCPIRLLTRLRIRQHRVRRHTGERIEAAREMARAMRERGAHAPIFIKGFGTYALTANPDEMHISGDLDTFAEDKDALWDTLHGLGYTGKRKHTYEWAKLHRDWITVDIHQHFPINSYPPEVHALPAERLEAWQNPGHWPLPAAASDLVESSQSILWENLIAGATWGRVEGTEQLLFPSPTLLCLIHCVHCFRNCVTRLHYMDPRFRLYELLCIFDLARLPGFDTNQFHVLVDKFAAQDSVRLINTLAASFLGVEAVPERNRGEASEWIFSEHLIYGGWIALQRTEDWLWNRGMERMLQEMDANNVSATCRVDACDIPRLLTHGVAPPLPQIAIVWDAPKKSIRLDWSFPELPSCQTEHELLVHFGYGAVIKVHLGRDWDVRSVVQKSDYGRMETSAAAETVSAVVRMTCAVPIWPGTSAAPPSSLPLFLAVRRLGEDGDSTQAATYLPVQLFR